MIKVTLKFYQFTIFTLLLIGQQSFAQGIKVEKSFNEAHNQTPEQILVVGTTTYLLVNEHSWNTFSILPILYKLDEDGVVLERVVIEHESGEVFRDLRMIAAEDGGLYIAGNAILACDVPYPTPFINKYSESCYLQWTKSMALDEDNAWYLSGISLVEDVDLSQKLVFSISMGEEWHETSTIYLMDTDGELLDTIPVYNNRFEYYEILEVDQLIAAKDDSLFTYNLDGDLIRMREFSEEIHQIDVKGDTLIVLTTDSLSYLENDYATIDGITFGETLRNFRLYDDELYVHSTIWTEQYIHTLNYGLIPSGTSTVYFELPENHISHFSKEQYSVAIPFDLTDHQSVRYLNFSLLTSVDVVPNRTDIGVTDLRILNTYLGESGYVNLFTEVLVKNEGPNILTSCRINHFVWNGIACGESYYSVEFEGLNIAPGESAWIELGWTGSRPTEDPFGDPEEPTFNYCFYTSHANKLCDLNVPNDEFCRDLAGQLSLEKNNAISDILVYPNPFQSSFSIKNISTEYYTFTLYDLVGNAVLMGDASTGVIDANELPSGVYLLELSGDNLEAFNQLVIKE